VYTPIPCTTDASCSPAQCDEEIGYCAVDPYIACRSDSECAPGELCSEERGYCLQRKYTTARCGEGLPCSSGSCDPALGWCVPDNAADRCPHDDLCPYGNCLANGICDQQTFVFPEDFDPSVDCWRRL